jgi:hypothetical protein
LPYFDGGAFRYSPLKQPQGDFDVEVQFTYLNGPDKDPWTAQRLVRMHIRRMYLSPEKIKQRNDQKLGHLPQTGERAPKDGRYAAVFADDALTASIPLDRRTRTYGEGHWLGMMDVCNPVRTISGSSVARGIGHDCATGCGIGRGRQCCRCHLAERMACWKPSGIVLGRRGRPDIPS